MSKVLELAITRVDVKGREQVREVLTEALAEEGLEAIFIIRVRTDGTWNHEIAGNGKISEMLGKIEIAKHEQVGRYLRGQQ